MPHRSGKYTVYRRVRASLARKVFRLGSEGVTCYDSMYLSSEAANRLLAFSPVASCHARINYLSPGSAAAATGLHFRFATEVLANDSVRK